MTRRCETGRALRRAGGPDEEPRRLVSCRSNLYRSSEGGHNKGSDGMALGTMCRSGRPEVGFSI